MASVVTGENLALKIEQKVFGCVQSLDFATTMEMIDAACAATGNFKTQVPGAESWTGNFTAVIRVGLGATDVSLRELYTKMREKALVDVEYEIAGLDGYVFTAQAYLSNISISKPDAAGIVTFTGTLIGASPLLLEA